MSITACCPACGTTFRVAPEQLRASDGWVRCGRCSRVFDTVAPVPAAASDPDEYDAQDDAPWTGPAPSEAMRHLPSLDLGMDAAPPPAPLPPVPLPPAPTPAVPKLASEPEPETVIAPASGAPIAVLRQADRPVPIDDDAQVARSARERLGATTSAPPTAPAPRRAWRIAIVIGVAVLAFVALLALRWRDTLCAWVSCGV